MAIIAESLRPWTRQGARVTQRRVAIASMLGVALLHALVSRELNSYHALWSPDCGGRLVMIRSWAEGGSLIHLRYRALAVDPQGSLYPVRYVTYLHGRLCALYPAAFPFLCGLFYRLFGFGSLTFVPLLSGMGALGLLYAIAVRLKLRSRALLPLVVGLATPLVVYSVVFWDHSLQMLVAAAGGYALLRAMQAHSVRWALASGALFGLGLFVHETLFALFLALLLGSAPLWRDADLRRLILGLVAGYLPALLLWLLFNQALYGTPLGPHLQGPNQMTRSEHLQRTFQLAGIVSRAITQIPGGAPGDALPWLFALLLLAYVAVTHFCRPTLDRAIPPLLLGAAALSFAMVRRSEWANGLFEATPLFLLALTACGEGWGGGNSEHRDGAELVSACENDGESRAQIASSPPSPARNERSGKGGGGLGLGKITPGSCYG